MRENNQIKEVYLFMDDTEFNSDDNVSTGLNRKTIKLTDNIKLLSNIIKLLIKLHWLNRKDKLYEKNIWN